MLKTIAACKVLSKFGSKTCCSILGGNLEPWIIHVFNKFTKKSTDIIIITVKAQRNIKHKKWKAQNVTSPVWKTLFCECVLNVHFVSCVSNFAYLYKYAVHVAFFIFAIWSTLNLPLLPLAIVKVRLEPPLHNIILEIRTDFKYLSDMLKVKVPLAVVVLNMSDNYNLN